MRYKLDISYNGKNYSGFQKQKDKTTIQELLEKSLSEVLREEIVVVASGRTDGGVSAFCQVCHFDTTSEIDIKRTVGYTNKLLNDDIRVLEISRASDDFHARYSAKAKTYEYLFYIGQTSPIYDNFATYVGRDLDIKGMQTASKFLIGEHDFTSFCASNTDVKSKVREIFEINIIQLDDNLYKLTITGNGFLYNMVRIIMGTLVSVGLNKIKPSHIGEIIAKKDRGLAGKTMPSKGLYLKKVFY